MPHIPFAIIPKKSQVFCATMEKQGFPGSRRSWGLSNCKGGAQAEEKVEEEVEEKVEEEVEEENTPWWILWSALRTLY